MPLYDVVQSEIAAIISELGEMRLDGEVTNWEKVKFTPKLVGSLTRLAAAFPVDKTVRQNAIVEAVRQFHEEHLLPLQREHLGATVLAILNNLSKE